MLRRYTNPRPFEAERRGAQRVVGRLGGPCLFRPELCRGLLCFCRKGSGGTRTGRRAHDETSKPRRRSKGIAAGGQAPQGEAKEEAKECRVNRGGNASLHQLAHNETAASCLSRRQMDSAESAPCIDAGVVAGQRTVRSGGRGLAYAIPRKSKPTTTVTPSNQTRLKSLAAAKAASNAEDCHPHY